MADLFDMGFDSPFEEATKPPITENGVPRWLGGKLDAPQMDAALDTEGPSLILAGAGSGKTRVLTHKIAHLVMDKGLDPSQILAVTFTNKASKEMLERLYGLLGGYTKFPWMGTFHSICVRILRQSLPYMPAVGTKIEHTQNFTIYDDDDTSKIIKRLLKARGEGDYLPDAREVKSAISSWKGKMVLPPEAREQSKHKFQNEELMAELYGEYQKELLDCNAMDFDDLLLITVTRLEKFDNLRNGFRRAFECVLVDEYQDTNYVQYKILKALTREEKPRLTVVGDDDQSIYAWRGADIKIFRGFSKDFLGAKIHRLEQNYRSTKWVVSAAGSLIENNERVQGLEKKVFSTRMEGEKPKSVLLEDERAEAEFIVNKIGRAGKFNYSKTAVFYRTNALSRVLEETFRRAGIPYKMVGGLSFFQRKEVKDVLSYLKLIENLEDNLALERCIGVPKRGIGGASVNKCRDFAAQKQISLFEAMKLAKEFLGAGPAKKIEAFVTQLDAWKQSSDSKGVAGTMEMVVLESGYKEFLLKDSDGAERLANVEELISMVVEMEEAKESLTLSEFLIDISLDQQIEETDEIDAVWMMTLHASKGLEFPTVFVVGCEEGLLPMVRRGEVSNLEEERRLMYVGMTRAQDELYLTRAFFRRMYGRMENKGSSRFLEEIKSGAMEEIDKSSSSQMYQRNVSSSSYNSGYSNARKENFEEVVKKEFENHSIEMDNMDQSNLYLQEGSRVEHLKFGRGVVLSIQGEDENAKVKVRFGMGEKTLIYRYAKLKILG